MNEQIKIFESPQFGQIRTAGTTDEPLFCAADVCKALGYSNNRDALARHVDEADVVKHDVGVITGKKADGTDAVQQVSTAFVNESGLYTLIFGSNLKAAKEFKHWVTSEVLPTIRNAEHDAENEQIQIFENPQFGIIRTAGTSENPMFCLADICKVLELQVTPTKNRLKADGVNSIKVIDAMGRSQNATFVNEQNLYFVIMRSDKPQARAFQDWVCGDVLPTIRKTGKYEIAKPMETPPAIAEMQTKIDRLQSTVDELVLLVRELKAQKPKAIGNSRLVFGIFQPGEQILMKDKRLYDGVAAPFRNYAEVWRAKRKGCPFRTPETQRRWSINAEELERWLTSIGITTQRNKK